MSDASGSDRIDGGFRNEIWVQGWGLTFGVDPAALAAWFRGLERRQGLPSRASRLGATDAKASRRVGRTGWLPRGGGRCGRTWRGDLDHVLNPATGAIELLVEHPARQVGDNEANIRSLRGGLDTGDDRALPERPKT